MKNKLILGAVVAVSFAFSQAHAESYKVENLKQLANITEKANIKQAQKLQKFIDTLNPKATGLTAAQTAQYCQIEQQIVDENYQIYDENRSLFNGMGSKMTKADFIKTAQTKPIAQALQRQGVVCSYK